MRMPWILGDSREVAEEQRETVQETVDSNPRCSPVTLTALPLPEPSPPGDIAFVCLGQQFSYSSTWASALLALRVSKCSRWSGISSQDRAEVKKKGEGSICCAHLRFFLLRKERDRFEVWCVCSKARACMYTLAACPSVWHLAWTKWTPGIDSCTLLCIGLISHSNPSHSQNSFVSRCSPRKQWFAGRLKRCFRMKVSALAAEWNYNTQWGMGWEKKGATINFPFHFPRLLSLALSLRSPSAPQLHESQPPRPWL